MTEPLSLQAIRRATAALLGIPSETGPVLACTASVRGPGPCPGILLSLLPWFRTEG